MSVSESLRAAIESAIDKGTSRYRLAKDARVSYDALARYLDEHRDIRLSTVDSLAEVVGLELCPKGQSK